MKNKVAPACSAWIPLLAILLIVLISGCTNPANPVPPEEPGNTGDIVINLAAIPGIPVPVFGATPVTTITETGQYTGSICWNDAPETFAANTEYTATIMLTAKTGYTLSGVPENFFSVTGASASNSLNSGVVTAVFPATGDGSYNSANIGILRYVPPGKFQRDSTAGNISVISNAYRMSQHEITRAQFLSIMGLDPSYTSNSTGMDDPIQGINWYYAIAFCNKLSIAEGLDPVYSVDGVSDWAALTHTSLPDGDDEAWNAVTATWTNNGYRLPTEMEWFWAAMGAPADGRDGGVNTSGYSKAFAGSTGSNSIGDYAVFGYGTAAEGATTVMSTKPVGSKLPNELGLHDMTGNVEEWLWDWYSSEHPGGILTDFRGGDSGSARSLRGGSWGYSAGVSIISGRAFYTPPTVRAQVGFRVVRP